MRKEEYAYNDALREYEKIKKEVTDAIELYSNLPSARTDLGMSEVDFIRLTRFLQIGEKYLPKREMFSADQTERNKLQYIFMKLLDNYRSSPVTLYKRRAKKKEKIPSINSFMLSDKFISALRSVRHADFVLRHNIEGNDIDIDLDMAPQGEILRERKEGPGILDDYRQANWGIERICLDGMQNHLPNDAKGTQCWLHFYVDGKWVDCEEAKRKKEKITKIRFSDNGVGFTPDNLLYLHSTKTSEKDSVGQFGEGMKLASMASVNLGLGMELQSRNWSALASGEQKDLVDTRNNDKVETRTKLVYDIKEFSGEPIVGSRTIFHTPTPEFIDYALTLPEKVLELDPNYRPIFTCSVGDIVSTSKPGKVYVKGVYVQDINSIFSYNFDDANVNPDRNQVVDVNFAKRISEIMCNLNDKIVIKKLLSSIEQYYKDFKSSSFNRDALEISVAPVLIQMFRRNGGMPSLWREAFKDVFENKGALTPTGEPLKAILKTDFRVPEHLTQEVSKYNIVELYKEWVELLSVAGVKKDIESLPEFYSEIIPTSLSVDYGRDIWDDERAVLDAVQNHLPADSGGTSVFIRFQTKDGKWHSFSEFSNFRDEDIKRIKIFDDGNGYDARSLGVLASIKTSSRSTGKWGEGLKMLSAVALRNGYKIELRSRDWLAVPKCESIILNEGQINEKRIDKLVFEVFTRINNQSNALSDSDTERPYFEKSSTTFVDPTPAIVKEFRTIQDKILPLQNKTAKACDDDGKNLLLDFTSGKLYVRNILIPGNHHMKYGYHFKDFDVETRDRNFVNRESLQREIKKILEESCNVMFISKFLHDALEQARGEEELFIEFSIPFKPRNPDLWIKMFKECFGEQTAIRKVSDQDMNAVHQAEHMSLQMITLPDEVFKSLSEMTSSNGNKIPSYESEIEKACENRILVPEEELTEYEKFMINHLLKYNEMLPSENNEPSVKFIKVYEYDSNYDGPKARGIAGQGDTVWIERDCLNGDLLSLGDVFFHEATHAITGAKDAEKIFRDFLSLTLSSIAMKLIPLGEPKQGIPSQIVAESAVVELGYSNKA